ncbi:PHP domain-containing protein [Ruminococcaceae bacterium OttesenSCG-928-O06]|nr:PHP domain-containing protein [Ruminococcaceae bacterium OttesenSCG-928-O06]
MNIVADLHTHTIASGHALSTLHEMAQKAHSLGHRAIAITDHGTSMPGGPHKWYFNNLLMQPDLIEDGFLLLKGIEANVMDVNGRLDVRGEDLKWFGWVIASLHKSCIAPPGYEATTELWLRIAETPGIDMIGHAETEEFLFDYDRVTRAFAKNGKVVELNASSRTSRPGNEENLRCLAKCCMQNGTQVAVTSDAHSLYDLGNYGHIFALLEELRFPEEQVVNASTARLLATLQAHGRKVAERVQGKWP